MAPSATETTTVPVPAANVGNGKTNPKEEITKPQEPDVESPTYYEETLPERLTGHKEPLKLSGALNQFEHFDVTPVIGREYVNVNLAELLRAPNSDDLIRDLAITSMSKHLPGTLSLTTNIIAYNQYPSVESSSSASKTK